MLEQRLYVNATFHTQWAGLPRATALLARGERILAVGTPEELRAHATGTVETIDLGGTTVIPGLTDAHIHTANYAREIAALDLRGTTSLEDALARVPELRGRPAGDGLGLRRTLRTSTPGRAGAAGSQGAGCGHGRPPRRPAEHRRAHRLGEHRGIGGRRHQRRHARSRGR